MVKFQDNPLSLKFVERFQPFVKKHHVSPVARSKNQFLDQLRDYGSVDNLDKEWAHKRYLFLIRTVPAYTKTKATHRRWLSLLTWAYYIDPIHEIPESEKQEIEEIISELKGKKSEDKKAENEKSKE